jgi:hypothetical protein
MVPPSELTAPVGRGKLSYLGEDDIIRIEDDYQPS